MVHLYIFMEANWASRIKEGVSAAPIWGRPIVADSRANEGTQTKFRPERNFL